MLLYTARSSAPLLQFKVHGELPLLGIHMVEENESTLGIQHCFTIYGGNRRVHHTYNRWKLFNKD